MPTTVPRIRAQAFFWIAALGHPALGQLCTDGSPLLLGSVVELSDPCPSGPGPLPSTTCRYLEVQCDGLAPLRVELRVTEPDTSIPIRGSIIFGTGGGGTGFYANGSNGQILFQTLTDLGFRIVDRKWPGPNGWTTGEAGLRRQSCRYATLATWIHDNIHIKGAFCASGNSGGSAEIGFALTTWGRADIFDLVVPTSGPAVSRLDNVCPNPIPTEWDALCSSIVPPGTLNCPGGWPCSISGNGVCFQCDSEPTLEELRADSVMHLDAVVDYPNTRCHFLYGELDCGISVPAGLTWSTMVTSEVQIEYVPNTPHSLASAPEGRDAIVRAIDDGTTSVATCPARTLSDYVPPFNTDDTGPWTIVPDEFYVIYSGSIDPNNPNWYKSSNIYVIRGDTVGAQREVWLFGSGYGDPDGDVLFYRSGTQDALRSAQADAQDIDSVIQGCFGLDPENVQLRFITPHFHLDHINQELFTGLETFGYDISTLNIFIHENDYDLAICGESCCCDGPGTPGWGTPFMPLWDSATLAQFQRIGTATDGCNDRVMGFNTPVLGPWSVYRNSGHTEGTLDLQNVLTGVHIHGAELNFANCLAPPDFTSIEVHGRMRFAPGSSDCNGDGDVNLEDFVMIAACLAGPDVPSGAGCSCGDVDFDADQDLVDFAELQRRFSENP